MRLSAAVQGVQAGWGSSRVGACATACPVGVPAAAAAAAVDAGVAVAGRARP